MNFYEFPHTPHLVWLGAEPPRQDKVLAEPDAAALIDSLVTVEEKVDGANVGLCVATGCSGPRACVRPYRGKPMVQAAAFDWTKCATAGARQPLPLLTTWACASRQESNRRLKATTLQVSD